MKNKPYIFLSGDTRRGMFYRYVSLAEFGRLRRHLDRVGIEFDAVLIGSLL
jgi:hypothetical protein